MTEDSLDPRLLLAHVGQLRTLARGLVGCEHRADDLVQDTLTEAIERSPTLRVRSKVGNWLSVVLRNRARRVHRTEMRREKRERVAALPEAADDPEPDNFDACRRLVAAVDALPSTYRTVITLRYFEQLPPREIAKRLDVPVATVRTRTARALERLRSVLDDSDGRASWIGTMSAFALADPTATVAASTSPLLVAGAAIVETKTNLTLATVTLLGIGILAGGWALRGAFGFGDDAASRDPSGAIAELRTDTTGTIENPSPAKHGDDTDVDLRRSLPNVHGWKASVIATHERDGRPARGVEVRFSIYAGATVATSSTPLESARLRTDHSGHVHWAPEGLSNDTITLVAENASPDWQGRLIRRILPNGTPPLRPMRLDLARLDIRLVGRVTGPDGAPIPGATVNTYRGVPVRTDASGGYETRCSSGKGRATLSVRADGFTHHSDSITLEPETVSSADDGEQTVEHDVELQRGFRVFGTVRDERGQPIENAVVFTFRAFQANSRTDAAGDYSISWVDPNLELEHLSARHASHRDANASFDVRASQLETRVDIVMADGIACRGVVVDEQGAPVEGALVFWRPAALNNDQPDAITRRDGTFEITGGNKDWALLSVRAEGYALENLDVPATPETASSIEGLRIVLGPARRLYGTVTSTDGEPLPGIPVFGQFGDTEHDYSKSLGLLTRTTSSGKFELEDMPRDPVSLSFVQRGYQRANLANLVGDHLDIHVELTPVAGVAGTVYDAVTGAPIRTFDVRIVSIDDGEDVDTAPRLWVRWIDGLEFQNVQGHWDTIEDARLQTGHTIGVQIRAAGYAPSRVAYARATVDPSPDQIVTRLVPGTSIHGRILAAADRSPITDARVFLVQAPDKMPVYEERTPTVESRSDLYSCRTDAGGLFTLDRGAGGDVRLLVIHPEYHALVDGPFSARPEDGRIDRTLLLESAASGR